MPDPDQLHILTKEAFKVWNSGGWLMVPLAVLSFFIYYTALELYFRLMFHPLIRNKKDYHKGLIDFNENPSIRIKDNIHKLTVQYNSLREHLLNKIKRRTKFLGVIITIGPLMGLLGTVLGILNMFNGMVASQVNKFDYIAGGINKALITTQTGLIIAIPAYFILTLIHQRRKKLELAISQIEQNHIKHLIQQLN